MSVTNAYRAAEKSPSGMMEVERDALLRSARNLEVAAGSSTPRDKVEAVYRNNQLWSALAFDCASDANRLPEQLRANIISLAMWVVGRGAKVVSEGASVDPLVEINRNIAAGIDAAIANYCRSAEVATADGSEAVGRTVIG